MMQIGLGGFGLACIAFLWPQLGGGFGSAIKVGLVSDVLAEIRNSNGFLYRAEGRMWLTEYPNGARGEGTGHLLQPTNSPAWRPAFNSASTVVSSPCTRSALTSAAGCPSASPHSGSSAPATARSTTASVRSAAVRPLAAWTALR